MVGRRDGRRFGERYRCRRCGGARCRRWRTVPRDGRLHWRCVHFVVAGNHHRRRGDRHLLGGHRLGDIRCGRNLLEIEQGVNLIGGSRMRCVLRLMMLRNRRSGRACRHKRILADFRYIAAGSRLRLLLLLLVTIVIRRIVVHRFGDVRCWRRRWQRTRRERRRFRAVRRTAPMLEIGEEDVVAEIHRCRLIVVVRRFDAAAGRRACRRRVR